MLLYGHRDRTDCHGWRKPGTATSTFTQPAPELRYSSSMLLCVHRDRTDCQGQGEPRTSSLTSMQLLSSESGGVRSVLPLCVHRDHTDCQGQGEPRTSSLTSMQLLSSESGGVRSVLPLCVHRDRTGAQDGHLDFHAGPDPNPKHWFTTSFLQQVPESDARSVVLTSDSCLHGLAVQYICVDCLPYPRSAMVLGSDTGY